MFKPTQASVKAIWDVFRREFRLSAMLGFCPFSFSSLAVTEMCECPSQLPRTQPVHMTSRTSQVRVSGNERGTEVQSGLWRRGRLAAGLQLRLAGCAQATQWQLPPHGFVLHCAANVASSGFFFSSFDRPAPDKSVHPSFQLFIHPQCYTCDGELARRRAVVLLAATAHHML